MQNNKRCSYFQSLKLNIDYSLLMSSGQNPEECDPSIPQGKLHRRCHMRYSWVNNHPPHFLKALRELKSPLQGGEELLSTAFRVTNR